MSVMCPGCGRLSQDEEFCDHCNTDLSPPSYIRLPERLPELFGRGRLTTKQRQSLVRPESAVELPAADGTRWRLHWLPAAVVPDWQAVIEQRARFILDALPPVQRFEDDDGLWIAAGISGKRAQPWQKPLEDPLEEIKRLLRYAAVLGGAMAQLHQHRLVWLNFDPFELEEIGTATPSDVPASLRITNLDLEVFAAGAYPERLTFKASFAAPEISRAIAEQIGPATDVFHLAMFCYCWLARKLPGGLAGAGLESFDYHLPGLRTFVPGLPPGVAATLMRGLAVDPAERFANPADLLAALSLTIAQAQRRWTFAGPLRWEIGSHTRTGRAKTALGGANEDNLLTKEFADPPRAFVAVADGITTCDVGTGGLASAMLIGVLDSAFTARSGQNKFGDKITQCCQDGGQKMLDWALAHGREEALRDGLDLMGSTLTAAWLQDGRMILANLGDSRIYLVTDEAIEQLTVDGDLGSNLLTSGTPPEQVRDLGGLAKALRECVGGCQVNYAGELVPLAECLPTLSSCHLLPGDVVILCSDGLVEEHIFLDPQTVLELVRENRSLSAAELALLLVERADATQRLPSPEEPEGLGDNIACIVVKISK